MKQTWRWFGPADTVTTADMLQAGVEGVVSALHHVPTGAAWSEAEIAKRQREIGTVPGGGASGLAWEVVESLPVSEAIKTQGPNCEAHLAAYVESMEALAAAGLEVICYNFMPVLDWTRTALRWRLPHGGSAMRFDLVEFAVFDIHLLARAGAAEDYGSKVVEAASERFAGMGETDREALQHNIVAGLPGANDNWTLADIRRLLDTYRDISAEGLRANLIAFLERVAPEAERLGLRLCCHPDDPPFPIMGLPRIMSTAEDYAAIMPAVDTSANGITLCTGSMGVAEDVDFVRFVEDWGNRIHFVHLRNTRRDGVSHGRRHSFHESAHLDGDTDMVAVIRALLDEEARRREAGRSDAVIPMRPDHGHEILSDIGSGSMPGYPLVGRMRGLAELRGVMAALA